MVFLVGFFFFFINFNIFYNEYLELFFPEYKTDFEKRWLNNQRWGKRKEMEIMKVCVDLPEFLPSQELCGAIWRW